MRLLLAAAIIGLIAYFYKPVEHPKFVSAQYCWQPFLSKPGFGQYVMCSELDRYEYI